MSSKTVTIPANDVIDIKLPALAKRKIRIDGDDSRIIYLNTSDMTVLARLADISPKLMELQEKAQKLISEDDLDIPTDDMDADAIDNVHNIVTALNVVDRDMRELVDYIFNAAVSDAMVPDGSMYDIFNGTYRFEYIIETLIELYSENIEKEAVLMQKKMNKHLKKYGKG